MLQDVRLPEGRVIKEFRGGPKALKKVIDLLRSRGFSGYLKVTAEDDSNVGYVVMGEGKRVVALSFGPEGTLVGEDALPHFKEMAIDRHYNIELHTDVDVELILRRLPTPPKERKKEKPRAGSAAGAGKGRASLGAISQSLANVIEAFAGRRKEEKGSLQATEQTGKKKRGSKKKGMKGRRRVGPDESEKSSPPEISEDYGQKRARRPPVPKVDTETGLLESMTFESYLSAESNRFAQASCHSLAEGSLETYSPLFLVAESGLGKTHLLNATGWALRERNPYLSLRYLTAARFTKEIEEAEKAGKGTEFRRELQDLGALILDDIQDLKGSSLAQEALFDIFEKFHAQGKPLILASDRRPGEIEGLDSRLASRLQSGLVAVLKPPDLSMRLEFLRFRAKIRGVACPVSVLRYLAESSVPDLRGLEGALNTVLAYAATMQREVDLDLAREAVGDVLHSGNHVRLSRVDLLPSRSYLVEDETTDAAFMLFVERAKGVRAMMVTRMNPARVRERVNTEGAEILWLTDRPDSLESTVEPVLERLAHTFESLISQGGAGVLMLDGVEYLKSNHGFEAVLGFIRHLVDEISESHFTLILAVDPATLEPRELRVFEREMEVIRLSSLRESGAPIEKEVE